MSVSVTEMARQDQEQEKSSKKRKHSDEERAERKKKKKLKHAPVEVDVAEAEALCAVSKKKEKTKAAEEASVQPMAQQDDGDIELVDVEQDTEIPATEEIPTTPKKRRKQKDKATNPRVASPAPKTAEQEHSELPDVSVDLHEDGFGTPQPFTKVISSTAQPVLPSDLIENTPFHTVRASLYVPCPAISLSTALPSLISTHLTPLLLTYYAPFSGIVLSITDVSISNHAAASAGEPLKIAQTPATGTQYALCADDGGVSFTWLTGTFTTFQPTLNTTLAGYINVASEGFIGLVLYNYFQVGIARSRIPKSWSWTAPGGPKASRKQPKKGRIRDSESVNVDNGMQASLTTIPDSQASDKPTWSQSSTGTSTGHWTRPDGTPINDSDLIHFRVVDIDTVPSNARDSTRLGLQIEGTLLDEDEEASLLAEERIKFDRAQNKANGRKDSSQMHMTSGGLGREGSVVHGQRHRVAY